MVDLKELETFMKQEFGWTDDDPPSMYSPLPTPTSIRLLKVLQDSGPNDEVFCEVKVVNLNDLPQYAALSYTWGDPGASPTDELQPVLTQEPIDGKYEIFCDGHTIMVTNNCVSFLYTLRQFQDYIQRMGISLGSDKIGMISIDYIWIDAICINQNDLDERSSQVRVMDRIYRQAQQVVVWMGPSDSMTRPALKAIMAMAQISVERVKEAESSEILDETVYERLGIPVISEHEWRCTKALYDRTWFTRSWTIQEIVLSRKTFAFCGQLALDMKALIKAAQHIAILGWERGLTQLGLDDETSEAQNKLSSGDTGGQPQEESQSNSESDRQELPLESASNRGLDLRGSMTKNSGLYSMLSISFLRYTQTQVSSERWLYKENTFPLQTILRATLSRECFNPSDKIYSVLGIISEASWQGLPIDYSIPTPELYIMATSTMIRATQSLSILSYIGNKKLRKYKDLPSWVPDFTSPGINLPLDLGCGPDILMPGRRLVNFSASLGLDFCIDIPHTASRVLHVRGIYYDTIENVADFEFAALQSLGPLVDTISSCPRDLLWRTVLANEHVFRLPRETSPQDSGKSSNTAEVIDGEVFALSMLSNILVVQGGEKLPSLHVSQSDALHDNPQDLIQQLYTIYEKCADLDKEYLPQLSSDDGGLLPDIITPLERRYPQDALPGMVKSMLNSVVTRMQDRVLFTTTNQRLGTGMRSAQTGDEVWVLAGGKVPYVLRPKDKGQYELIGESYMHDVMYGELVKEKGDRERDITLI